MINSSSDASAPVVELAPGTIVYDVEGEKVGKVIFSTLHTGYFVVEQGWLLTRELYLPPGAIQLREEDWIKLRLSKAELKQDQWKSPPLEHLHGASPKAMVQESEVMGADSSEQGWMRHLSPEEGLPPAGDPVHLPSEEEPPPLANR